MSWPSDLKGSVSKRTGETWGDRTASALAGELEMVEQAPSSARSFNARLGVVRVVGVVGVIGVQEALLCKSCGIVRHVSVTVSANLLIFGN